MTAAKPHRVEATTLVLRFNANAPQPKYKGPLELRKGESVGMRFGVYVHGDVPASTIEARWQEFAKTPIEKITP